MYVLLQSFICILSFTELKGGVNVAIPITYCVSS